MKDIFQVFVKAGLGTIANMIVGLARNKIIAFYLGPQGLGLISLLQQFQSTVQPIVTLGGDTPLVQGLASTTGETRQAFLVSAFAGLLVSWSLCTIAVLWGGNTIGKLLLGDSVGIDADVIPLMVFPLLASAVASFLLSLLTTVGAVGSLQKGQFAGNLAGMLTAILLCVSGKLLQSKYLIAYLTVTSLFVALVAGWYIKKAEPAWKLFSSINFSLFQWKLIHRFFSFGGITIITGFIVTATWLMIRRNVLTVLGPEALGYFSATVTLSGLGLSLISTALSSFYLPRFASADKFARPKILRSVFVIVAPLAITMLIIMQLVPELVVKLLFSSEFIPMVPMLRWWVAGDTLRAISYVFAIPIFAAAHLRFAFVSEIVFSGLLLLGVRFALSDKGSLVNLGHLYFMIYCLYLVTVGIFAIRQDYV